MVVVASTASLMSSARFLMDGASDKFFVGIFCAALPVFGGLWGYFAALRFQGHSGRLLRKIHPALGGPEPD